MGHALTALIVPIIARIAGADPGLEAAMVAKSVPVAYQCSRGAHDTGALDTTQADPEAAPLRAGRTPEKAEKWPGGIVGGE